MRSSLMRTVYSSRAHLAYSAPSAMAPCVGSPRRSAVRSRTPRSPTRRASIGGYRGTHERSGAPRRRARSDARRARRSRARSTRARGHSPRQSDRSGRARWAGVAGRVASRAARVRLRARVGGRSRSLARRHSRPPPGALMVRTWLTLSDGSVQVDGAVPELTPRELEALCARVITRWRPDTERAAAKHQIPVSWILAVIYAETLGDPTLTSSAGAYGLMQIMPFNWGGRTRAQMADGPTNIDVGAGILAGHARRMGPDLPKIASGYNAGASAKTGAPHSSAKSPWGMRENTGYISRVVAAHTPPPAVLAGAGPKGGAPAPATPEPEPDSLRLAMTLLALLRWFGGWRSPVGWGGAAGLVFPP